MLFAATLALFLPHIFSFYSDQKYSSITLFTAADLTPPIITEVSGPRSFFVTQTGLIDLAAYATAFDETDGDITDRLVISCSPAYPDAAGEYTVTYDVTDLTGNHAQPLSIKLVVWEFVKIQSGNYHTLALTSHGRVYSWGFNFYGQLGYSGEYSQKPRQIDALQHLYITDIATGTGCSFALDKSGQAYAWGNGANGRLGTGSTNAVTTPTPVAQGDTRFVSLSARFTSAGGLTASGEVYTWGYGGYGALGTGAGADSSSPVRIAVEGAVQLEMGNYNGAARTADGRVYTWGDNLHGQLGRGLPLVAGINAPALVATFAGVAADDVRIADISAGLYHMLAASESGEVYSWGYGAEGRLGSGGVADKNVPILIDLGGGQRRAAQVEAAYSHSAVRTGSGEVFMFGQGAYGKLGVGSEANALAPRSAFGAGAGDVTLALDSTFVLVDGRAVYGTGYGGTGVLGTGNNNNSNTFTLWSFTPPNPE